jgi:hypothetical protein
MVCPNRIYLHIFFPTYETYDSSDIIIVIAKIKTVNLESPSFFCAFIYFPNTHYKEFFNFYTFLLAKLL